MVALERDMRSNSRWDLEVIQLSNCRLDNDKLSYCDLVLEYQRLRKSAAGNLTIRIEQEMEGNLGAKIATFVCKSNAPP